jgi:serine/threonine protein kinase
VTEQPKYRRIIELGRGGMAFVSLTAMHGTHGVTKLVVVKELHDHLADDPECRARFLDEARLAARLNHPNVVQTYAIVDNFDTAAEDGLEGACALVMEYLEGQPLNRFRSQLQDDPRALSIYLAVLIEALSGIDYAHKLTDYQGAPLNIVHRDISPHNVFVTYAGEVKVLDFGIAKANDASSAPTQSGTVKGKLAYMAPEQARGDRVDARADVFSCGVMLWEAAVGRRLWTGLNDAAIMYRLMQGEIPSPREARPDVPERLDAICRRALAHDPEQRYPSAAALRDDLEAFVATLPEKTSRRALGDIVSSLFAEQRAEVRRVIEEELGRVNGDTATHINRSLPKLPIPESSSWVEKGGTTGITQGAATTPNVPRARTGLWIGVAGALLAVATVATLGIVHLTRPAHGPSSTAASTVPTPATSEPASSSSAPQALAASAKPAEPKPSATALGTRPTSRPVPLTSAKPGVTATTKPSSTAIDVGY